MFQRRAIKKNFVQALVFHWIVVVASCTVAAAGNKQTRHFNRNQSLFISINIKSLHTYFAPHLLNAMVSFSVNWLIIFSPCKNLFL